MNTARKKKKIVMKKNGKNNLITKLLRKMFQKIIDSFGME